MLKKINKFDNDLNEEEENSYTDQSRYKMKKRSRVKRTLFSTLTLVIVLGIGIAGASFLRNNEEMLDNVMEEPEEQIENNATENIPEDVENIVQEVEDVKDLVQEGDKRSSSDRAETPKSEQDIKDKTDEDTNNTNDRIQSSLDDEKEVEHKVISGDSLYKLSIQYYNSSKYQQFLAWHNDLENSDDLQIGEIVKIPFPPPSEWHEQESAEVMNPVQIHEVAPGDTLYKISIQYYNSASYQDIIAEQNNLDDPEALKVGDKLQIPSM